jgi:hypothetical protein
VDGFGENNIKTIPENRVAKRKNKLPKKIAIIEIMPIFVPRN